LRLLIAKHGRHSDDRVHVRQGKIKIARHRADHGELLEVLLPEQRHIGLHLIEQFAHHGGHPVEMARPRRAAQPVADTGDRDIGGKAGGIHLADGW
jgi:hypothetical protein